MTWTIADLEKWDERISELAKEFGLDSYPQEFEICDSDQMLDYMAYSGMPSHYPHWSFGKTRDILKTRYDYGVAGLPYEMVINSNPALAYLMRDNSLTMQALTIGHVYGHNDFFKNNLTFKSIRADLIIETFKVHAKRVRAYVEDPSIGLERVEQILDAAHTVALNCRRNLHIRKMSRAEQEEQIRGEFIKPYRKYDSLAQKPEFDEKKLEAALNKNPLKPEEDLLLFIRDNNHSLKEWEKDLLTIVHERNKYFVPQIETKIMNEGWASFWHYRIMYALREKYPCEFTQGMMVEFIKSHSQVLRPHHGELNPYHLGFKIWEDIEKRWDSPSKQDIEKYGKANFSKSGREKIFEVREVDRDTSFLRQYLTEDIIRELDLFEYAPMGDKFVVTKVADKEEWKAIRETLIQNTGTNHIPVITVESEQRGDLFLKHQHDGRDLQMEYADKTLKYTKQLWSGRIIFDTMLEGKTKQFEMK